MLVSIRVERQPCKWCVVQEVRANEVEDAELQQAIARSLQDTKPGSLTTPCTQLHRHDYIEIHSYIGLRLCLVVLLACKFMTYVVPGVHVHKCVYERTFLQNLWLKGQSVL